MDYHHLNAIWRSQLKSTTRLVAIALADFIDQKTGHAWPRVVDLMERTGLCDRQVRRELEALVERAYFDVKTHDDQGGRLRHPRYRWCYVEHENRSAGPVLSTGRTGGPVEADSQTAGTGLQVHSERTAGPVDPVSQTGTSNTPKNHQPTHPGSSEGGGDGLSKAQRRARLDATLNELLVASGPKATPRWIQLAHDRGARSLADYLACIRWSVRTARAAGQHVNFATDVVEIAKGWRPIGERLEESA